MGLGAALAREGMASPFSLVPSDFGALLFRKGQYPLESDYIITHTYMGLSLLLSAFIYII